MAKAATALHDNAPYRLTLNLRSVRLTEKQFCRLCGDNPELRLELTSQKELIVMPPTGAWTSWRNSKLNQRLAAWAEYEASGLPFDSSAGFTLPNGAICSPDAAWVSRVRWESLSRQEQEGFPRLCPDFVVELRSPSDGLSMLQAKMQEYLDNGARLGWLIDPQARTVHVYRPGQTAQVLKGPTTLPGENVLPGFAFNVGEIW